MDLSFYEKAADTANYIYFRKNIIAEEQTPPMLSHFHDSIEFVFMIAGECLIHINTEENRLRAGEISFARCFEPHFYVPSAGAEYFVVLISSRYLGGNDFSKETFPSFIPKSAHFEKILRFLELTYSFWDKPNELLKNGFADMLLGLMNSFYPRIAVKSGKATQSFVEILKYINDHFRQELTLEGLADRFGYTKTYLSEQFNKFTGMKLRDYINRRRINEFYRLKGAQPKAPVCRIAQEAGFGSLNTFYRVHHKYTQNPNF